MNRNILLVGVLLFFLIGNVSSLITSDLIIKEKFYMNEKIEFSYTFLSDVDVQIAYKIDIDCPSFPVPQDELLVQGLQKDLIYEGSFSYALNTGVFSSQNCVAHLNIFEPFEQTVSKEFQIITDSSLDFSIKIPKKIFTRGENINIDYESSIENLNIDVELKYPDGIKKNINLPKTIKADSIGTYELSVTASKEGYSDVSLKKQFGVIERDVNVGRVIQNTNVLDESTELYENLEPGINWVFFGILIVLILLFVVVAFIMFKIFKSND